MADALSAPPHRKRTRRILGLLALVVLAVAAAAAWEYAPRLSAKPDAAEPDVYAIVSVARVPPRILPESLGGSPREDREAWEDYRTTQAALVKSRLVLNAALRNPKAAALPLLRDLPEPLDWLEDHLRVDFQPAPSLMRIGLSGKDAEQMCVLVDAITKAYLDEIVEKEANRRRERLEQLRQIAKRFEAKLKEIRASP